MHQPLYLIRSVESLDPRYLRLESDTDDVWVRSTKEASRFSASKASEILGSMPPWYAMACEIVPDPETAR